MHAVAVGTETLLPLLFAVATIGGAVGFLSAIALRRKRRRRRTIFALGFLCGAAAAAVYDVRRHGLRSLRTAHISLKHAVLMSVAGK